jgi:hypothetical protein
MPVRAILAMMAEPAPVEPVGDVGMAGDGIAGHRSVAEHDIDETRRQAGADRQLGEIDGRKRRHLGGFQHHRVAGGERRTKLPGGHRNGKVPRRDGADDSIGLGHDHAEIAVVGRYEIASFLVGKLGEETDLLGGDGDIAGDEMADGARRGKGFELGEGFRFPLDEVCPTLHDDRALARPHAAPIARL